MLEFDLEYPDLTLNSDRYFALQKSALESQIDESKMFDERSLENLILLVLEAKPKASVVDLTVELEKRFNRRFGRVPDESWLCRKLKRLTALGLVQRHQSPYHGKRFVYEVAA